MQSEHLRPLVIMPVFRKMSGARRGTFNTSFPLEGLSSLPIHTIMNFVFIRFLYGADFMLFTLRKAGKSIHNSNTSAFICLFYDHFQKGRMI